MEHEIYFKFILSFALILIFARIGGEVTERYLKQPAVVGELVAGIIISPFALGGFINDPVILNFATIQGGFVENGVDLQHFAPMEIISQIAVIILLFVAGLETDVRAFLRHGITGTLVAFGGVIVPFGLGYFAAMKFFPHLGMVAWLFMGATLTATSIGITVRILMDMKRLNTREGTIILVGAVVDDIIGLVILSVVVSMAETGELDVWGVVRTGLVGFGVWFALLMLGVYGHRYISRFILQPFKKSGTMPIIAIIFGLLIAYIVTLVDLHPVVGAYVAGLMFAAAAEKEEILEKTRPIMLFLAPFFFTYLGMQVDLGLVWSAIVPAVVLIVLAIIGKLVGCYIPARLAGRVPHAGGMIVGIGMVPRGEVGLIIAGVGLVAGAIDRELFGAAVAVSMVTTLITPAMLKPFFRKQRTTPPRRS
ncbi:MAG: cation:proton antiporter [Dehalococcoidales bacterium]|nr:MAG: cation:proton antiporter [Dehalococcoidales bacterium]